MRTFATSCHKRNGLLDQLRAVTLVIAFRRSSDQSRIRMIEITSRAASNESTLVWISFQHISPVSPANRRKFR